MKNLIFASLLAGTLVSLPNLASAQLLLRPAPTGSDRSEPLYVPSPEALVQACFRDCFAGHEDRRAQVCGTTPDLQVCLGRADLPSCALARQAISFAAGLVGTICPAPSAAPVAAPTARTEPSEAERARRQRRLDDHRARCAGQGSYVADCTRCLAQGNYWTSPSEGDREVVAIVARAAGEESDRAAQVRMHCHSAQVRDVHAILADTRSQVAELNTTVTQVRTQMASLAPSGGGVPVEQAALLGRLVRAIDAERLSTVATARRMDLEMCLANPDRYRNLPNRGTVANGGRELAPADMVLWPADAVRRRGYEPRTSYRAQPAGPNNAGRCAFEQLRYDEANALVTASTQSANHVSIDGVTSFAVYLDAIVRTCANAPTSEPCQAAQRDLRAYVNVAPAATPAAAPESTATEVTVGRTASASNGE